MVDLGVRLARAQKVGGSACAQKWRDWGVDLARAKGVDLGVVLARSKMAWLGFCACATKGLN